MKLISTVIYTVASLGLQLSGLLIPIRQNSRKPILDNETKAGSNLEQPARAFLVEALENPGESESATKHLLEVGRKHAETGISDLKPLFIKKPDFPTIGFKQQTGSKIDVQKSNEGEVILEFDVDEKDNTRNIRVFLLNGPNYPVEPAMEVV